MARSSQGHSARNWLAGFLFVLALTVSAPQPALAFSLSDILNGTIANPATVFSAATSAGSQTFTNYVLYEMYDMINRWTGGVTSFLYEASGYMDDLSSLPSEVRTIRSSASSLVTTLNNVSASLRNTTGSAIGSLQSMESSLSSMIDSLRYAPNIKNISDNSYSILSGLNGVKGTLDSWADAVSYLPVLQNVSDNSYTLLSLLNSWANAISYVPNVKNISDNSYSILSGLNAVVGSLDSWADAISYLPNVKNISDNSYSILSGLNGLLSILPSWGDDISYLSNLPKLFTSSTSIIDLLTGIPGYISDAANSVVGALGNVAITFPDSITATLAPGASISVDADVAGEAAQAGTLWDTIVGDVDTAQIQGQMDATVGVLRTSFPFGCIFVLSDALSALVAAPVAPVFEADLPMIAGTYHAEIDLSFFDGVAALLRGGMVVVYVAGLYSATKHWVFNGGGESA